jgi:hypothetical protein
MGPDLIQKKEVGLKREDTRMFKQLVSKIGIVVCFTLACHLGSGIFSSAHEGTGTCGPGEMESVLHAFYPGVAAVDRLVIGDDSFYFAAEKSGGLGEAVAHCQFRIFAAEPWAVFLPDTWTFCEGDPFLGGGVDWINYNYPEVRKDLDTYFSDVKGSYRQKGIALLSLEDFQFYLKRLTYLDDSGEEHLVGSGEWGDPALTDPTAGDPKLQETLTSGPRDFFDSGFPSAQGEAADKKLRLHVEIQWAFIAQLEAGTYQSLTFLFFDNILTHEFAPVTLKIIPCP